MLTQECSLLVKSSTIDPVEKVVVRHPDSEATYKSVSVVTPQYLLYLFVYNAPRYKHDEIFEPFILNLPFFALFVFVLHSRHSEQ